MHAAVRSEHVVSERLHRLSIGIIILKSNLYARIFNLFINVEDIIREKLFPVIEALDVALDADFKIERFVFAGALIGDSD